MSQRGSNLKKPQNRLTVYIDGFNLYYGALKGRGPGFRWLDLSLLFSTMFPGDLISVKYFTAAVTGKRDPNKPLHQSMYWRALNTKTNISIIEGNFLDKHVRLQVTAEVSVNGIVPEEKGTDVNLAVHLVNDAHNNLFDSAVIVSNDSDLSEALRIVKEERNKGIILVNPTPRPHTKRLSDYASTKRVLREGIIKTSQFPDSITDAVGNLTKPKGW